MNSFCARADKNDNRGLKCCGRLFTSSLSRHTNGKRHTCESFTHSWLYNRLLFMTSHSFICQIVSTLTDLPGLQLILLLHLDQHRHNKTGAAFPKHSSLFGLNSRYRHRKTRDTVWMRDMHICMQAQTHRVCTVCTVWVYKGSTDDSNDESPWVWLSDSPSENHTDILRKEPTDEKTERTER